MKNTFITGIVSALCLASCATMSSFGGVDADDDGRISPDEAAKSPELLAFFSSADGNQDGYLNSAEFDNARETIQAVTGSHSDTAAAGGGGHGGHQH